MSSSSSQEWFYRVGRELRGPLTNQQLRELAMAGQIKPGDRIRQGRDGVWMEAGSLRGLFATTKPRPPAPPQILTSESQRSKAPAPNPPPAAMPVQQGPAMPCPSCGNHVQLPIGLMGQAVVCPYCSNQFTVSPRGTTVPVAAAVHPASPLAYSNPPQQPQANYNVTDIRTGTVHTPGETFQHSFGSSFGSTLGGILAVVAVGFVVLALGCGGCVAFMGFASRAVEQERVNQGR